LPSGDDHHFVDGLDRDFGNLWHQFGTKGRSRRKRKDAGNKKALKFSGLLSGPPETRTRDPLIKRSLRGRVGPNILAIPWTEAARRGPEWTRKGTPGAPGIQDGNSSPSRASTRRLAQRPRQIPARYLYDGPRRVGPKKAGTGWF
jgi:hypothetical protein